MLCSCGVRRASPRPASLSVLALTGFPLTPAGRGLGVSRAVPRHLGPLAQAVSRSWRFSFSQITFSLMFCLADGSLFLLPSHCTSLSLFCVFLSSCLSFSLLLSFSLCLSLSLTLSDNPPLSLPLPVGLGLWLPVCLLLMPEPFSAAGSLCLSLPHSFPFSLAQ